MSDLTVIYLTLNQHPKGWTQYQREILYKAIRGAKLISVSVKPINFGTNIIDDGERSHLNMYKQLLRACKLADTTYVATAEDDVLYTRSHFTFYRPPMDAVAYDMSRWTLYYWLPIFSVKQRISNSTLIAPREFYIEKLSEKIKAMEERGDLRLISEVGRYHSNLNIPSVKIEMPMGPDPVIHFFHPNSTDSLIADRKKRLGQLKATEIPGWGRAEEIIAKYV